MISVVTGSAVRPAPPRATRGRTRGRGPPPRTSDRLVFLRDSAINGWLHRTLQARQAPTQPLVASRRLRVRTRSAAPALPAAARRSRVHAPPRFHPRAKTKSWLGLFTRRRIAEPSPDVVGAVDVRIVGVGIAAIDRHLHALRERVAGVVRG